MDIFEKCKDFNEVKRMKRLGIYGYFQPIESAQAPEIMLEGKKYIMAGSNNYLGLADDKQMKQAGIDSFSKYGTGCAGSRFLNGNTIAHEQLEEKLAKFKKKEAGLIFSAGYQMNLGVVSCLLGKDDVAVVDKLDHASILDGVKLSGAQMRRYKHNDMKDLERILASIDEDQGKLIIVDGVFSMEGDICKLPEIAKLSKKYGARLIVDDAHGTGVMGKNGRGTCEHFHLENGEIDLVVGTCSKIFASVGGFVVGKKDVIDYLRHMSRSMIFSAALPPVNVATISKALDIIKDDPKRRKQLWKNTKKLKRGFLKAGFYIGDTETPIIPIIVGENNTCFKMWKILFEMGIFTNPVITPAVPPGHALIRVTMMATHTDEHVDKILKCFTKAGKELGLI